MTLFPPDSFSRLVVKVGSALLVEPDGRLRESWLAGLVAEIADRRRAGQQVAIVSSGAIALGSRRLGLAGGGRANLEDAQAAAAVGQIGLALAWADLLSRERLTAAQMLVTLGDLEDRRRYLNVSGTIGRLLQLGAVPVINENDSVATEEIRFGDNDRLAARVAVAANANAVILLSDIDGLYDRDPRDGNARHIAQVDQIDASIEAMAGGSSGSGMGTGGMKSKLTAARMATGAGVPLAIASGRIDRPLSTMARHTLFVAGSVAPARKAWLAGGLTSNGVLHIDAGAVAALRKGGSVLAPGVTGLEGRFARGDVISIVGPDGPIARGLVEYDRPDAERIVGKRSSEHEAILGFAPRGTMVHRDHLALLDAQARTR